jgi:hypothetical protein
MAFMKALIQPPSRLRAVPQRWVPILKIAWILAFVFAAATVVLGTIHAFRETYEVRPSFAALGLDYDLDSHGLIWIELQRGRPAGGSSDLRFRIAAIDGKPVAVDIRSPNLARRLGAASGPIVTLDLATADGNAFRIRQVRQVLPAGPQRHARDLRVAARIASGLLACTALLFCSFLLSRRRPADPVALLFAFAFAGMASTIDPPIAMWMALGWPIFYDVVSSTWFYLLLLALAVFPDGIFVPKFCRWLIVVGIGLAIFVSLREVDPNVQALVAIGALLAILASQVRRYRRLEPGIERQQIKWAAFGFTTGFLLLAIAFVLLALQPTDSTQQSMLVNMSIVLIFSVGMAAIPLGLLVALTRFRLWEADTVITRSAAYAVVTVVVGVVWAASSDLVKMIIEQIIGRESQAGATTVGAIIAAGIFSPTQSLVLGWTRKRFGGPVDRMRGASSRMKKWALTETPSEIAIRALAIIDDVIHPSASAIVIDEAFSRDLIAARNVSSADDLELVETLVLADEESAVGTLRLGRRSDGNRYNRQQLEAVQELIPSLAEALRIARSHHSRESTMQQRLDEMAARLAQLEGGQPKPA